MNIDLGDLRQSLERAFSLDELHTLCFDLSINFENLPGTTINSKTRELILFCNRQNKIGELIDELRKARPEEDWPQIPAEEPVQVSDSAAQSQLDNFQEKPAGSAPRQSEQQNQSETTDPGLQTYQADPNQIYQNPVTNQTPQAYDSLATFEQARENIWTLKERIRANDFDESFFEYEAKAIKMELFKPQQNIPNLHLAPDHAVFQQWANSHEMGWIPEKTRGLQGIDLSGTWISPIPHPNGLVSQGFARQFGPYINIAITYAGTTTIFSEGIINPADWSIRFIGKNLYNAIIDAHLQLQPSWRVQGFEYHIFRKMGFINNLLGRKSEPYIRAINPVVLMKAA